MRTLKKILLILFLPITLTAQWYQQSSGTQLNLNSIFFIDSNSGWAVSDSGLVLRTTDGGSNWATQSGITSDNLYSVYFENSSVGWIVGENVRIMKSTDGGNSWTAQTANPPFQVDLHSVQFLDINYGWAVGHHMYSSTGFDSYLLRTSNSGTTWENNQGFLDEKLFSVFFVNNNLGFVSGSEIARTTDGGANWNTLFGSFMDEFYSVFFINSTTGWIAGKNSLQSKGLIYKTTDGGLNWSLLRSDTLKTYTSVYFTDANNGWVSGLDGNVLYTSDGGNNWSVQTSGTTSDLNSIFFFNNLTGWAAGNNGTILKTINGGTPVELVLFTAIANANEIILNWTTATEINNQGFEIERKTASEDWQKISFIEGHGTTTETQHYSFTDNDVSSGTYQYRLMQMDYGGSFEYSNIIEVEVALSNKFSLSQNYPNPFNPVTKIKYSIPQNVRRETGNINLKIYDVLGREIATLVNEEKPAGEYEIGFSGTNLPSGIYFYQLKVYPANGGAGEFTETKKMILLK